MTDEHARALQRERKRLAQFREREAQSAARPRFVCSKCGKEFEAELPLFHPGRRRKGAPPQSMFVRIGGRTWCDECAAQRFPRRPDPDCPLGADRIELSARPTAARIHQ